MNAIRSTTTTLAAVALSDLSGAATSVTIEIDPDSCTVRLPVGLSIDAGGIGKGLAADLAVASSAAELVPTVLKRFGRLDVLVHHPALVQVFQVVDNAACLK